jgi:hypothetical protein
VSVVHQIVWHCFDKGIRLGKLIHVLADVCFELKSGTCCSDSFLFALSFSSSIPNMIIGMHEYLFSHSFEIAYEWSEIYPTHHVSLLQYGPRLQPELGWPSKCLELPMYILYIARVL